MNKRVSYKVSWTFGGRAEESRRFDEWEPAAQFYAGVVADGRCDVANLVEVTETEVRCFEREAARGAPARGRSFAPTIRGRREQTRTQSSVGRG